MDDHNHLRHLVPSIEGTWITKHWEDRGFQFVFTLSEVNALRGKKHFTIDTDRNMTSIHGFRRKLAIGLINNPYVTDDNEGVRKSRRIHRRRQQHLLRSTPVKAKHFCTSREIWIKSAKYDYQRHTCRSPNCKNRCRTYCMCSPSVWLCNACFPIHVEAEVTGTSS